MNIDEDRAQLLAGRRLSDADVSCALTHKRAIIAADRELQTQKNVSWVLIAEDDANLDPQTFVKIADELQSVQIEAPSLVKFYSAPIYARTFEKQKKNFGTHLLPSKHWLAGAVCYAINREAVRELAPFALMPVDNVADWPVYYARLKLFVSSHILVTEVPGQSTIGMRSSLGVLPRLFMHLRQLRHLRTLSQLYGLSSRTVLQHLIYTPLLRDVQGRIPSLAKILRVF
jgi:GR25 family glycosyltransferase involved in LPS biosynthesis